MRETSVSQHHFLVWVQWTASRTAASKNQLQKSLNFILLDAAAGATAQQLPKQLPQPLPKHMFSKAVAPRPRRPLPKPIAAAKADAPKQHPMQQLPEPTAVPKRQGPKQIAKHVFSKAAASKAAGSKAAGTAALIQRLQLLNQWHGMARASKACGSRSKR